MSKKDVFDDLMERLDKRFRESEIETNGDEMSLFTFCNQLRNALQEYNIAFIIDLNYLKKNLNKKISIGNLCGKKIPYVENIYPTIDEDGEYFIELYLRDCNQRYAGTATIAPDKSVEMSIASRYSSGEFLNFMFDNMHSFEYYLDLLDKFSKENPGIAYEWNNPFKDKVQVVGDDFLEAYIDLDRISDVCVSFSNMQDLEVSRTRSRKHGEIYDFVEFYKNNLMKRMKVNVNDFNPLFKSLYENSINKDEVMKLQRTNK